MQIKVKRIISILLTLIIVAGGLMNPSVVNAEVDAVASFEAIDGVVNPVAEGEIPSGADSGIMIEASQRIFSFGHVRMGAPVAVQTLTVTSRSPETILLDYQLCDAEGIFYISTKDIMSLAPGQTATFFIGMNEKKPAGYYTANLILTPVGHIGATVNVGLSAEIVVDSPSISYIGVKPSVVDMTRNSSYTFVAEVRGENNPNYGVQWSVEGNTSANTVINSDGVLSIGQNETAQQIVVRARSLQDSAWSATSVVRIQEGNYTVSTAAFPGNGGTTSGGGVYVPGSNVDVYAAPNNGFRFTKWTINGQPVSTNPKYTINNIRGNYELVANFEQVNSYVKVTAVHPEGGTISQSGNVAFNGSFNLAAAPKAGFIFEGWYEGGKKFADNPQITINNIVTNREFTANFIQNIFQIQLQANPQGTGIVTGAGNFGKGTQTTVSAKAVDGYVFDCWTSNGNLVSRDANYTITNINKDDVLVANFKKKAATTYTITSNVDGGKGSVTPAGAANIPEGVDVTYTFAPARNYTIASVTVDGKNVGAVPNYTFKNVGGNHSLSVKFTKIPETNVHSEEKQKVEVVIDNSDAETVETVDTEEEYKPENIEDEGVNEFLQYTELTGVLQEFNISEDIARTLIREQHDMMLLEKACEEQYLAVSVVNEYADNMQETESASYMNLASTPNFASVVDSLLTEDEKIEVFKGGRLGVNFNLFANNKLDSVANRKMANQAIKDDVEIGNFFDAVLIKNGFEGDSLVTELDVPMKIVLNIPQALKTDDREFFIMRAHENEDGTITIDYLPNESNDQSKIVFTTDKFSSYAIAYKGGKNIGLTQSDYVKILIGVFAGIIVTAVLVVIMASVSRRARRRKK